MGTEVVNLVEIVKYESTKDGKTYINIGIRLSNGYVIPVRLLNGKHYYQLKDLATQVVLNYTKKGE
jgi:hypothetical protein